jgi:hypothetical protein
MHPVITIFTAFTRFWAVDQWLSDLASMKHEPSLTNLCFIVDVDEPRIEIKLAKYAYENNYRSFKCILNEDNNPNEVRIAQRRVRIAEVKNQSKELIANTDGDYVLSLEDDTVFTNLDVMQLLAPYKNPLNGFVEGVQCGRWGIKMIGAWRADDVNNMTKIETLLPSKGLELIDAGGFYGYVTRKHLYLMEGYFADDNPYGPDVHFGLALRRKGWICAINWDVVFGHNDHNKVLWPDGKISKVSYNKLPESELWERSDVDSHIH